MAEMRENARLNYESGMENAATEGEAKGEAKEQLNTINKLLKKGLSPEEVSALLDLDLEKVLTIFKSLK
jgi:predicted transposase YdaD